MELQLQPTSKEIWESKYQLKDDSGTPIDKDIDDTYKRVARALAAVEASPKRTKEENEKIVQHWYTEFTKVLRSGGVPAGRILSNAGAEAYKPKVSLINCTVSEVVSDDIQGIMGACTKSAITLASGAGIGYEFSTLRPKGAYVSGAGAFTSGPLPFMAIFDTMCDTISSAGGRRGAQMGTFAVWHPDVEDFIIAKRKDGVLRKFNLSLLIDDEFMEAVKTGAEWKLVFPVMKKESREGIETVWKDLFWDQPYCEKQGYTLKDGKILCRVYKTVKAADLWDTIMQSTYNFAEPGFLLIDNINKYNNNYFCERIRSTNPSMPAGTLVATANGVYPIETLEGKEFTVTSLDGSLAKAKCFLSGKDKPVKCITFGKNKVIESTPEHRWPVFDKKTKQITKKFTHELKPSDLIPLNLNQRMGIENNLYSEDDGFLLGVFLGDGWLSERSDGSGHAFGITFNKLDRSMAERTLLLINAMKNEPSSIKESDNELTIQVTSMSFCTKFMSKYSITHGAKAFPEIVWAAGDNFVKGFIDGLMSTDGCVTGKSVILTSSKEGIVKNVAKLLAFHGIKSSITTAKSKVSFPNGKDYGKLYTRWDLRLSGSVHIKRFCNLFELSCERKQKMLDVVKNINGREKITDFYNKVESVTDVESKDVWDISVYHDQHVFPTEWGYTGNCGEQPLGPNGSCLLGSINLTKFVVNPFTPEAYFDFDAFEDTVRIFTRMLDNVVEINGLPLEEQRHELITKRRHGMGFTGLGSTLSMLDVKYGDDESIEFTDTVMKSMAVTGFKEGVNLAKEKGCAPILASQENRQKWVDGEYMKRIWGAWPEGALEVLEHGCRFTHHTSIAPTGTISLSLGNNCSNGIEPSFSHKYTRNVIKAGKKTKDAVDVYSYEMLLYKHITGNDTVPESFSTSDTVTTKEHVDIQAAAQYWCDSSISKTINVVTDMPYEDFKNVYIYAYDKGLKGCTTFRFNPAAFQGVLVKDEDLKNTKYVFHLEDGTSVEASGDTTIEYDGESHTAANLYDAIKEGQYAKF